MKKTLKPLIICCLAISFFACQKEKKESKTITIVDSLIVSNDTVRPTLAELKSKIDTTKKVFHFTKKDYQKIIPKDVQKYINKNFKKWTYPDARHWDEFWFKHLYTDSSLVNFVQGDFNMDNEQDYAFFLEKKKEKKIAFIIIQGKDGSFETVNFREMTYKKNHPKFEFGLISTFECDSEKCYRTYITDLVLDKDSITGKWKEGKYTEKVK